MSEAEIKASEVIIRIVIEDLCCVERELQIRINSNQVLTCLRGQVQSSWELRFIRNKCLTIREWFENVALEWSDKKYYKWLGAWSNRRSQIQGIVVIWHN